MIRRWTIVLGAVLTLLQSRAAGQSQPAEQTFDVETLELRSEVFGNNRTLRVLLPPGYREQRDARYPVLYLNDGFAVFRSWGAPETVHRLIGAGQIEPIILVGIDNAGAQARTNEYLPYPDPREPDYPDPQGRRYPEFLTAEVMPLINARFRTKTDPASTGLGGSSYGGYIALYTALHAPGKFDRLLIESSPLFIDDDHVLKDAEAVQTWPARVSIAVGVKETPDPELSRTTAPALARIEAAIRKAAPETRLRTFLDPEGEHNSKTWKRRLPEALVFLYGK